jgi:hypothetical protein
MKNNIKYNIDTAPLYNIKNVNKYNIYEAFLYTFKNFILVLTYTPGFDIDFIIDDMIQTFNFKLIKLEGPSDLKQDSIFNYDKLNNDVIKYIEDNKEITSTTTSYGTGILITGLNIPSNILKFKIDLHLHFSLSSNLYLKTVKDSSIDEYNKFQSILVDNKINKYFNIKSFKSIEINNSVFEKIIDYLEFKIYGKDYNIYSTKSKLNPAPIQPSEPKNTQKFSDEEIFNVTTDAALSEAENQDNRLFIVRDSDDSDDPDIKKDDSPLEI